ncbi:MAG: aldo/keto reductase [Dehalococcoidia bacterium]
MDPFAKRQIGRTGVWLTPLGLGGAPIGGHQSPNAEGLYRVADYAEGVAATRCAYDLGIRYFDTAPFYGIGRSEVRYGAGLSARPRNSFVLSTKVGRVLEPDRYRNFTLIGPDGLAPLLPRFDYTREGIRRSHAESLYRLLTDHVDILFLHDTTGEELQEQAVKEVLPELARMRREGLVRAIGAGTSDLSALERFVREFDLDVVLLPNHYTLLSQQALDSFLPLCQERNVSIVIGTPYCSGILASDLSGPAAYLYQPAPPEVMDKAKAINAVCKRHGVGLKTAALQFVLAHPSVVSVIPGARNTAEIEENARVAAADIPSDFWAELKHEGLIHSDAPVPSA